MVRHRLFKCSQVANRRGFDKEGIRTFFKVNKWVLINGGGSEINHLNKKVYFQLQQNYHS